MSPAGEIDEQDEQDEQDERAARTASAVDERKTTKIAGEKSEKLSLSEQKRRKNRGFTIRG